VFGHVPDFVLKHLIASDAAAAGHTDLDKNKILPVFRIRAQEPVDGAEAFTDAFCVVDPVDANSQDLAAQPQLFAPAPHLPGSARTLRRGAVPFKVQADGKRPHRRGLAAAPYVESLAIDLGL